jgi:hypothetical protein
MRFKNLARGSVTMFFSFLTSNIVAARQFRELRNSVPVKFEGTAAQSFCLKAEVKSVTIENNRFVVLTSHLPHLSYFVHQLQRKIVWKKNGSTKARTLFS